MNKKVVCIDTAGFHNECLTLNKEYTVTGESPDHYLIEKDDEDRSRWFFQSRFKDVEKVEIIEETPKKRLINVAISLTETSQVVNHPNVSNTYTKGPFYCVYVGDKVYKYPVANIWRITEDYGDSGR